MHRLCYLYIGNTCIVLETCKYELEIDHQQCTVSLLISLSQTGVIPPLTQVLVEAVGDIERCTELCLEPMNPEHLDKLVRLVIIFTF